MSVRLIFPFIWLIAMISLASQGSRIGDIGITENEKRRIEEADIARQVTLLDKRNKKKEFDKHHPSPRPHLLGDGIQEDTPIMELMDEFRGFL